jgi:alpha-galactosidase
MEKRKNAPAPLWTLLFVILSVRFVKSSHSDPQCFSTINAARILRLLSLLACLPLACLQPLKSAGAAEPGTNGQVITVSTARSALVLWVGPDARLYQLAYGSNHLDVPTPAKLPPRESEFYPQSGDGFILEPALQVTHSDGNTSTDLRFVQQSVTSLAPDIQLTRIELKDGFYPFHVTICLKAYQAEDVIEQWAEVRHEEGRPLTLFRYDSAAPVLPTTGEYWLTHFHGDWADEAQWVEEKLSSGVKMLDSKIGVRAHQYRTPSFLIALDHPAQEETGQVFGGSLEWSGSFQLEFELDVKNHLRALAGINPSGEQYHLASDQTFTTAGILWTWSDRGKGQVSRNFHRWARRYGLRDGTKPRPVLLNNWEATGFKFDEARIVGLFDGARALGAETFLLDDGWFGNRHPRNDDKAGLGDWQVNTNKLPHGLGYLADEAKRRDIRFGIWIEPEMVNPASDLFEQHPEWAIGQKHREVILGRNQRVLDLSRPEVREFTWKVIQDTLAPNHGITYVKWDCNCYVTQPGSSWLGPNEQSHLLVDYQRSLYDIMGRMATNYPQVMGMLCSGGAGRIDYGALRYFDSFWPSDNTDPARRVFIQWGFSHFFPACAIAAHVTRMGQRPLKFTLDVAMSGALGLDLDVSKLTADDRKLVANAVALYKKDIRDVVQQGDLYRLESPYLSNRSVVSFVSADRLRAVVLVYRLKAGPTDPVILQGLAPQRRYRLHEVNLPLGVASELKGDNEPIEGAALMREGIVPPCQEQFTSSVIEVTAEPAK